MPAEAKNRGEDEVITRGKLIPIIVDLKDFIASTVKSSETAVRKEISAVKAEVSAVKAEVSGLKNDVSTLQVAVTQHSKMLVELKGDVSAVRTELKGEMHQMEQRLSDKIDKGAVRLDDHETRIASLEGGHR